MNCIEYNDEEIKLCEQTANNQLSELIKRISEESEQQNKWCLLLNRALCIANELLKSIENTWDKIKNIAEIFRENIEDMLKDDYELCTCKSVHNDSRIETEKPIWFRINREKEYRPP